MSKLLVYQIQRFRRQFHQGHSKERGKKTNIMCVQYAHFLCFVMCFFISNNRPCTNKFIWIIMCYLLVKIILRINKSEKSLEHCSLQCVGFILHALFLFLMLLLNIFYIFNFLFCIKSQNIISCFQFFYISLGFSQIYIVRSKSDI